MDEKRTAVEKTEQGIVWTDNEGKRHEFQRPIRTLYIEVVELQARQSVERYENDERPFDEPLAESFSGIGQLEDLSIEKMGLPESRSRAVKIRFHPLTEERAVKLTGSSADNKLRPVTLAFSPADWETGGEAGWWVECPLPPAQFDKLSKAFASRQIKKLELGLELNDAYIEFWYAVPADKVHWLVPPDDTLEGWSVLCRGFVNRFSMETPPLDLRPPEPVDEPEREPEPEPGPDPSEYKSVFESNVARSLELIYYNVDRLRSPLVFIGWALVAVVVILLVKVT